MKLPFYTATKGLERYPANERFIVYRSTHKQLLKEDAVYRKRCNAYIALITCLSIVPTFGLVSDRGFSTVFVVLSALLIVPLIIYFAFRQQNYMNARIGDALQKTS